MPKALKWTVIAAAALVLVVVAAALIAPLAIDLERYKPFIETQASNAIGRPVKVEGKLEPSLFPWVGVAVHELRIANPPGFEPGEFVSVGLFEIRVKLWPLLFGDYQVRRFVLDAPQIVLIRQKNGKTNWEGLGGASKTRPEPKPQEPPAPQKPLPFKDLAVGQLTLTDGTVHYFDHAADTRHEITAVQLRMEDVSLDKPVELDLSALADGRPVQLSGTFGPLGGQPGQNPVDVDLKALLLKRIELTVQGTIARLAQAPQADLSVQVAPFSLRAVMEDLKQPLPLATADRDALTKIALSMKLSGTSQQLASQGVLSLDNSQMSFTVKAREFEKPSLHLEGSLDRIDLDRYLPPPNEKASPAQAPPPAPARKTDYSAWRSLVLDARIKINDLKAKNARTRNIELNAKAANGVIRIDPLNLELYDGRMSMTSTIDVRANTPRTEVRLSIGNVQAGPFLKDLMKKETIEGQLNAALALQMAGDSSEQVRRTLGGQGELKFTDGALIGIDIAGMVRNVQSAFGLAEQPAQKPRTDFSELVVPFTIDEGVVRLKDARLQSPLLRVAVAGRADLAQETLDVRVEPKFVTTLKGQGDVKERAGLMVPVLVGGTFDTPTFRPDLKSIVRQDLPSREELKKMIPPEEELKKGLEKKGQDLLKGLQRKNQQ